MEENTGWNTLAEIVNSEGFRRHISQPNWNELLRNCTSVFDRHKIYRQFYEYISPEIKNAALKNWYYSTSIIDWMSFMTQIEQYAYMSIKCRGLRGFYPQYPVLNYILDFGNPYIKVGIETDGKDYHDPQKDRIRDQELYSTTQWKIYRVSGKEAYRQVEHPSQEEYFNIDSWYKYLMTTVEGVIEAIHHVYFSDYEVDGDIQHLYYQTLLEHKLANFDI